MISGRRDWRWWLPWRLWLLAAGLACTGVVTAKSAYWWGYSQGFEGQLVPGVMPGVVAVGPSVGPSGEVRLEVEVVDGRGGPVRTEALVINGVPEPGVAGLIGIAAVAAALRRRRGVRE